MRPTLAPIPALALAASFGAALLLSACAVPPPAPPTGQTAANRWAEPDTGSLIGGVNGGADQNTSAPDLGFRNNVAGGK